jgi:hypothetical protein
VTWDAEREVRSQAQWDAFEDWWEDEVQARMERIEARADVMVTADLCGRFYDARFKDMQRAEEELVRAARRADARRRDLARAEEIFEQAARLVAREP